MPAVVEKKGSRWVCLSHKGGRILGTHKTRGEAAAQARAVNASLHRKGKI